MKIKYFIAVLLMLFSSKALAETTRQVPLFFNFQSALIDEGGNPLPDGATSVKFQISDAAGTVLYEEMQELEAIKGQVSAIVGNGLNVNGSPTGGIPEGVLDPTGTRYLQVEVAGQKAYDPLEIVSVPYAMWADTALRLPDKAITGSMIGDKVITGEHLDEELYNAILQGSGGAGGVHVDASFSYSGSQTVQGVLKDLDAAIKKRQDEIDWAKADYGKKISDEAGARGAADSSEVSARTAADAAEVSARQAAITSEASTRSAADTAETSARQSADSSLQSSLNGHAAATATHGISTSIAGTDDAQTLTNKVLVAPKIVSGANANPNIGAQFNIAASEGVVIDGNVTVTGKVRTQNVAAGSVKENDVSSRGVAKAWGSVRRASAGVGFYDCYNCSSVSYVSGDGNWWYEVRFDRPFTNDRYVIVPQSDFGGAVGTGVNIMAINKTPSGFVVICTDGGTNRKGDIDWSYVVFGTLAD